MGKTKILVLAELYWPQGGGAELATHLILKNLQKTGKFQITVLTGVKNIEKISGIEYIYTSYLKPRPKPLLWLYVEYMCRTKYFRKLIEEHDVVYIPRIAYPAIPHAKKMGKKVIVHLHNYQPITYHSIYSTIDKNLNNPVKFEILEHQSITKAIAIGFLQYLNKLTKYWLLKADKIICVSKKQRNIIVKHLPELASKIEIVPNPLPEVPPIEKEEANPPVVLYLGGDSYIKGFHRVLDLAKKLAENGSKLKIIFVGKYSEESKKILTELSSKYENIEFEGYVPHDKIWKLYSISKAVLVPLITEEPAPYTIIEAVQTKTAIITRRLSKASEVFIYQSDKACVESIVNVISGIMRG